MSMPTYEFSLSDIIEAYQKLNQQTTWKSVCLYGGLGLGTWAVYSFAVKPFLSPLRKLPGPGYNPVFGNVREAMVGEAMETSVGLVKKFGGVVRFYHLFGRERVLVASPTALKRLLVDNANNYERNPAGITLFFNRGIFFVTGDEHKNQRLLMNPVFNHESINSYLGLFEDYSDRLINYWSSQMYSRTPSHIIQVQKDFKRLALDVICQSVFGYDVGSLENPESEFAKAFSVIIDVRPVSFLSVIPFSRYLPTARNRELSRNEKIVNRIIMGIIAKKREELADQENPKDFLSRLMLARDEHSGRGLSDEELRNQVLSLLIAGHETTSVTLSWLLLTLAQNQDIQGRVREEVLSVLPASGNLAWDDLDKLHYTAAVLKETMRLYPAAPTFTRVTKAEDVLDGHVIPAGTTVIYHVGAMMRNPAVWSNPQKFDPSRFLSENSDTPGQFPEVYTHLPFATGPHKCLGHQFAKMQMKMVLVKLIREFKFDLVDERKFTRKLRITLTPDPPVVLAVSHI